jgi:endothelin-converting enzyme/putative endopeptidase
LEETVRLAGIASVTLFSISFAFAQNTQPDKPASLPYTPSLDVNSMEKSVDPCTDFYTYSCGGWLKQNPIPADQASWGVFGKAFDQNLAFLRSLLEEAAKGGEGQDASEKKIGDYYSACMDEATAEKVGAAPLKPGLDRIAKIKSQKDLADALAQFHAQGADMIFDFDSAQDAKDATQFIARADQGGLGLPDRDFYFQNDAKSAETRANYLAHVTKMFQLLGDSPDQAGKEAQTVIAIETALAKSSQTRVERRDPYAIYHKMTTADLEKLSPSFPWLRYLSGVGLKDLKSLNVASPDFFKGMNAQLKSVPLADWKTYLRWHLAHHSAPYLSSAFVNENFNFFRKQLYGAKELAPRWKRCTNYVDRDLGEALGKVYVARVFTPETKERTLKMVQEIEAAMGRDIEGLPWMSPPTKKEALKKLHAVANKIGYPDRWRDYSRLTIERGNMLGNFERSAVFEFDRELAKIGKPVDRGEWGMTPPTVNAEYNPTMNDINFPAAQLQPPFFDPKMDDAPNYGDEGSTIGHELTHGFDDEGRQYDEKGNLRDWWTPEDAKHFQERAKCVSDQMSSYTIVDNIKINGDLTLGEDVADLGGNILAWAAWKEATKDKKLEPIDGFTPEQRWFIGNAQQWCTNERDEILRVRAVTDPHSPPKYRANAPLTNMPEFGEAFSCKAGSPMVKEKKDICRVW